MDSIKAEASTIMQNKDEHIDKLTKKIEKLNEYNDQLLSNKLHDQLLINKLHDH